MENLADGGGYGVDIDEVAEAIVADVMIDIDPAIGVSNGVAGGSRTFFNRVINDDGDIKSLRRGGGLGEEIGPWKKAKLFGDTIFIPDGNGLAEFTQAKGNGEG